MPEKSASAPLVTRGPGAAACPEVLLNSSSSAAAGSGPERAVAGIRHDPASRHKELADAFNELWFAAWTGRASSDGPLEDLLPPPLFPGPKPFTVSTVDVIHCGLAPLDVPHLDEGEVKAAFSLFPSGWVI